MNVAELITHLQKFDPSLKVRMTMNGEYECGVDNDMVYEFAECVYIDSEGQDSLT